MYVRGVMPFLIIFDICQVIVQMYCVLLLNYNVNQLYLLKHTQKMLQQYSIGWDDNNMVHHDKRRHSSQIVAFFHYCDNHM